MTAAFAGFWLGLSLIMAIGAQNAFVLKQGLKREFVFLSCITCSLSDAILIGAGVAGFGSLVTSYPSIEHFARYGGAIFLFAYGAKSFYSAFTSQHALTAEGKSEASALRVLLTCLAFTWLNPHVYLDTVVLLGSISTQYSDAGYFALGAISGSSVFFFSLGYGARLLRPYFEKPSAWKVLEFVIGIVMFGLASSLLVH